MNLKKGDRVKVIRAYQELPCEGKEATVVAFLNGAMGYIALDFGERIKGVRSTHNLDGQLPNATGWWFPVPTIGLYVKKINKQIEFDF